MIEYCRGTGSCVCRPDLTLCDVGCVDLKTNDFNCGECNHACNGQRICRGGVCI